MKFLIIDDMHPSILPLLAEIQVEVDYLPDIKRDEILAKISEYEGLIFRSKTQIDAELLEKAANLQIIARAGAGLDNVNLEEVQKRNIHLCNAPEGNRDAVAEHTIGLLLGMMNNMQTAHQEISNGKWLRVGNRGYEIKNKTVGIIGYGNIGREVAHRLSSFGCEILAFDKNKKGYLTAEYADKLVQEVDLDTIFQKAHIISLHIPLNKENKDWVNTAFFEKFKHNIWFINTSRGEIVVQNDLVNAIKQGKILGAGLDVLENEKLHTLTPTQKDDFDFLTHQPNVYLTPHVAGWTHESYLRINEVLVKKIKDFKENKAYNK